MSHKKTDEGYPIFRSYLEEENDKPYYSMNTLSFYYEDMERKQKLIEDLAKAIVGYDQTLTGNLTAIEQQVAERFDQWDEKLKTFDGSVMDLLQEWVDDGTMDHIVDSSIVDRKLAPITAQLAEKAKKSEVELFNARVDEIITTPVGGSITQQEIIDARQTKPSLGANITSIKEEIVLHKQNYAELNLTEEMVSKALPNGIKNSIEIGTDGNYQLNKKIESVDSLSKKAFNINASTSTADFTAVNFYWGVFGNIKKNSAESYVINNYTGARVTSGGTYTPLNDFGYYYNSEYISLKIPKAQLATVDIAGIKKWFDDKKVSFVYELLVPETKILPSNLTPNAKELIKTILRTEEIEKKVLKNTNDIIALSENTEVPTTPSVATLEIENGKTRMINAQSRIVRFGAWNLAFGHIEYQKASEEIIKHGINYLGLQEYRGGTNTTILNSYKNSTMPHHYWKENIPGLAILTLHNLYPVSSEGIPLEFYDGYQQRVMVKEVVYVNGKTCSVYTVHLDVNRYAMVEQVADCVEMLNADTSHYKIILGDFNAYGKETFDAFTNAGYKISNGKDGVWVKTFKIENHEATSYKDNIIVSPNIDIIKVTVFPYGDELSDHHLLVSDLAFN